MPAKTAEPKTASSFAARPKPCRKCTLSTNQQMGRIMLTLTDNFLISIGFESEDVYAANSRGKLYIAIASLMAISVTFLTLSILG